MSDTTKLRAIQEALDAQRALDVDGLDPATRTSAERLARVDAWLRARPEPTLDDPEAFAARIEAHLGTEVADDFDPLATPDFSDFGDASDFGDVEAESGRVVSITAAPGVAKGSGATSSAVTSVAAPSAALAAASPASASASRATGGASSSGESPAPRMRGWWFASAAVVLLAASGTFVAFRSASSPESAASPAGSSAYDLSATTESVAFAPGAPTAEPAAAAPMDDGLQEEAATQDLGFARERSEGRENRAGGAVGGASVVTGALDGPREQATRAHSRPSPTMSAAPSTASVEGFSGERRALPWASEVTETTPAAPPTATTASPQRMTSTVDEASGDEDDESLVRIDRWRARVLSCVPASVRTLTTRVESRNGRVSAILGTSPTLDSTARGCVETALRGAPLSRPSATLRWKREL